jgi:alkylation response protein AidB-like acyl-CoA dehydrogenase
MARIEAAETAYAVALESMRVHGGYGYTSEFSIERYYRDAARLLTAAPEASDGRRQVAGAWVATQRP